MPTRDNPIAGTSEIEVLIGNEPIRVSNLLKEANRKLGIIEPTELVISTIKGKPNWLRIQREVDAVYFGHNI